MGELFGFIWSAIAGLFRSRAALQAEILVLRHQLNILRRKSPKRVALGKIDRLVFCGLYRLSPTVLDALKMLQPETVIRWHRAGFRAYWRWRSQRRSGRPRIPADIRHLILEMSVANPLWGAPRISRRTAQAWDRCRPDHGCKIHGPEKAATVARLEDLPSQSCRRYRVDRPVCRPHDFVSAVVCPSGPAAFAPGAFVVGRDGTSKCRMDCPSINRGLRLE